MSLRAKLNALAAIGFAIAIGVLGTLQFATRSDVTNQGQDLGTVIQLSPCLTRDDKGNLVPDETRPLCQVARNNAAQTATPAQSCSFVSHAELKVIVNGVAYPILCGVAPVPRHKKTASSPESAPPGSEVQLLPPTPSRGGPPRRHPSGSHSPPPAPGAPEPAPAPTPPAPSAPPLLCGPLTKPLLGGIAC